MDVVAKFRSIVCAAVARDKASRLDQAHQNNSFPPTPRLALPPRGMIFVFVCFEGLCCVYWNRAVTDSTVYMQREIACREAL